MTILLSSSFHSLVQLIGALIIFAFVLGITYLTTRWMGGFQKSRSNNKNLHIIETINVGNNKYISIVEAGTVSQESFTEILEKLKDKLPKKQD